MKLAGALLAAALVGAALPENSFNKKEIVAVARQAIVKDYAANGVALELEEIFDQPMDYEVDASDLAVTKIELGFATSYIAYADGGIPDYCNVSVEVRETTKTVTMVSCSPID